jgi:23S rRNA pseudouridine1911/1915/1917 synthase
LVTSPAWSRSSSVNHLISTSAPTLTSSSDSNFFTHVLIQEDGLLITSAIDKSVGNLVQTEEAEGINGETTIEIPPRNQRLTPHQLLLLGSVWYLPADEVEHNNNVPADQPHLLRYKPQRLSLTNRTFVMQKGDYLRIHHTPRRFTRVYEQNWSFDPSTCDKNTFHQVIQQEGEGFWIIDKPPLVPVHATVDNTAENVIHQLGIHNAEQEYITPSQRLDVNTSGLLVVATKPAFAAYFAQLLRRKTKQIKKQSEVSKLSNTTTTKSTNFNNTETNIQKGYKCLVCIQDSEGQDSSSVIHAWQNLKDSENETIRHFLESSDRAPKRFETVPPPSENSEEDKSSNKWLECLLRIRKVSPLQPIPTPTTSLAKQLWAQSVADVPPNVKAVCEVEIQLLTGRTHQIRGQLSKLGFPIVGDEQYGGAIPKDTTNHTNVEDYSVQMLALQCCRIAFRDANYEQVWNRKRKREITQGSPSDRWVVASLGEAWWTPFLTSLKMGQELETTSSLDFEFLKEQQESMDDDSSSQGNDDERVDLLPRTVQLSPGKNKYILIKVVAKSNNTVYWFVKSASPGECGGPYHANVAQDLIEWLRSAGFSNIKVTGGGRIDYDADRQQANVYGFSYGFGKGDHAMAADLISKAGITAIYDDSNELY